MCHIGVFWCHFDNTLCYLLWPLICVTVLKPHLHCIYYDHALTKEYSPCDWLLESLSRTKTKPNYSMESKVMNELRCLLQEHIEEGKVNDINDIPSNAKQSIFKNDQCKPICILYNEQAENGMHFILRWILRCSATTDIRDQYMPIIYNSVEATVGPDHTKTIWSNEESRLNLVLNSSCYLSREDNITAIKIVSRQFLYALCLYRTTTIATLDTKPNTPPITHHDP